MIDQLTYYNVIQAEIATLHEMVRSHATGHIHTAIYVLELRLHEIKEQMSDQERMFIALRDG